MTVSINTRTWVEVWEVISSKTSNKATLDPTQLVTDQQNLWPIGLGRYARHALGIIPGETYREPLQNDSKMHSKVEKSGKLQAASW